jgi:hypothetical protein
VVTNPSENDGSDEDDDYALRRYLERQRDTTPDEPEDGTLRCRNCGSPAGAVEGWTVVVQRDDAEVTSEGFCVACGRHLWTDGAEEHETSEGDD